MKTLYIASSIIYRLVLTFIILLNLLGNILAGAAGHNKKFEWSGYIVFIYLILTVSLLTVYNNIGIKRKFQMPFLFFTVASLIFISIVLESYLLYEIFFVCKCFTTYDNVISLLISIFIINSTIVFFGLFNERRNLLSLQ